MVNIFILILILIGGMVGIIYSSKLAVMNSARLASALGISSLVIGVTLVSIGTDISEIFNSIIASSLGHGDINVGDSVGSILTQITLVFGLLPFICGTVYIKRTQFLIIGSCQILALILIFTVVEKGFFTRLDALFMMMSFIFYTLLTYNVTKTEMLDQIDLMEFTDDDKSKVYYLILASVGFLGVAISSYIIIQSIIALSEHILLDEYLISFFILSIGTSLPELSVEVTAIKRKKYNIAIGDVLGSCIVDASISIAIGNLLFPQEINALLALPTILYAILASLVVIILVSYREKMDKKAGSILLGMYIFSFILFLWIL